MRGFVLLAAPTPTLEVGVSRLIPSLVPEYRLLDHDPERAADPIRLTRTETMELLHAVNPFFALSGFLVGALVGLTGVGGGSLMTPVLVLIFGVQATTAVGTDLLYAATTKSVGTVVHHRRETIDWRVTRRLATGSIPATIFTLSLPPIRRSAFTGVKQCPRSSSRSSCPASADVMPALRRTRPSSAGCPRTRCRWSTESIRAALRT